MNTLRRKRKQDAIEYLGGACKRCGGSFHPAAMQFHHRDPAQKDFAINSGITMAMSLVKEELDKCDLLCANCHAEIHAVVAQW